MHKLTPATVAITLMAGCSGQPPLDPQHIALQDPAIGGTGCNEPLRQYETVALMDREQRQQALATARDIWSLTRAPCDQLNLALLLSRPDNPPGDQRQALKLLGGLLEKQSGLDLASRQLARLLHDQQQQRELQQTRIRRLRDKLQQERAAVRRLLERLGDLSSQLEQLKDIEKSINEKEQAIITPSANGLPSLPTAPPTHPAGR